MVDAVHFVPHFPIDVISLGVDFLLCSAYKFYGPHVGICTLKKGLLEQLVVKGSARRTTGPYRMRRHIESRGYSWSKSNS